MTWTDPTLRSTGDLITAAIWNADLVDNLFYLHDRLVTLLLTGTAENARGYQGDWGGGNISSGSGYATSFSFALPADFDALVTVRVLAAFAGSGTFGYDLTSDYGAEGESYSNHSASLTGQTAAVTASALTLIDAQGVFSAAAPGDLCALKITSTSATTVSGRYLGLLLQYTRV